MQVVERKNQVFSKLHRKSKQVAHELLQRENTKISTQLALLRQQLAGDTSTDAWSSQLTHFR